MKKFIWILDCTNGCTTKVNLSEKSLKELETIGTYNFLSKYSEKFGINLFDSEYMVTDDDSMYEVDF